MHRIMIIRHAEKHHDGSPDRGVSVYGVHTKHELTVRGWQRAGALVRYFAPVEGLHAASPVSTPATIFASAATPKSPSRRALRTVEPLAHALGVAIDDRFPEGQEAEIAAAALRAASPVLISWHHSHIVRLAHAIAGSDLAVPKAWPDDRFDVVWVLDRDAPDAGAWRFAQIPQLLLGYDRPEPI
jgi:phosphohistidine phosphatase SixA